MDFLIQHGINFILKINLFEFRTINLKPVWKSFDSNFYEHIQETKNFLNRPL